MYWEECIEESFKAAGIVATSEQIRSVAESVEISHKNYGMAHGYDNIPSPLETEVETLRKELKEEKSKVVCKYCNGSGNVVHNFANRSSGSRCSYCEGTGKL